MTLDDTQLLIRTSRGDEPAARALWDRHGPLLVAYARAILGTSHAHHAEDVVQDVMCSIIRMPVRVLRQVHDARAWLATSTRRRCLNTLRSAGRRARRVESLAYHHAGPTAPAFDPAFSPELARVLESLPRRLREVIYLRHAASLTFEEISLSLGRSRGTLSTHYQRALTLLREVIDPPAAAAPRASRVHEGLVRVPAAGA